jgi:hypothetical protein
MFENFSDYTHVIKKISQYQTQNIDTNKNSITDNNRDASNNTSDYNNSNLIIENNELVDYESDSNHSTESTDSNEILKDFVSMPSPLPSQKNKNIIKDNKSYSDTFFQNNGDIFNSGNSGLSYSMY